MLITERRPVTFDPIRCEDCWGWIEEGVPCGQGLAASGDKLLLRRSHPERSSDWSEVRLARGDKLPLSRPQLARLSHWSEVRPASGERSPLSLLAPQEVE
jgi:hypothetical protein